MSHGGSNGSFSDIKEYIEKHEPLMEKEKSEVAKNSRRLENRQKVLAPIIIEPEEPKEEPEANIEPGKNITEYVIPACIDMIKRMDYKTIFAPDDKTLGVRVLPDTLAKQIIETALKEITNNRTAIKAIFKNYIFEDLSKYNYEITLNNRKQPFSQFCGNIANCIMDLLFKEWQIIDPKEKKKK